LIALLAPILPPVFRWHAGIGQQTFRANPIPRDIQNQQYRNIGAGPAAVPSCSAVVNAFELSSPAESVAQLPVHASPAAPDRGSPQFTLDRMGISGSVRPRYIAT